MRADQRRSLITWGAALAAHAAVFGLAWRAAPPASGEARFASAAADSALEAIEMTLEQSALPIAVERAEALGASASPSFARASVATGPTAAGATTGGAIATELSASAPAVSGSASAPAPAPSAPEAASSGTALVITTRSDAELGLAGLHGPNPMFVPGMVPEQPPAAARGMGATLRERDAAIGLGPEGPILAALEEATRTGFVPERGQATFAAQLDERGILVDLRVLTEGSLAAWNDVRDRTKRALAAKPMNLRGGKGAELRITVTSDMVLPSGSRAPVTPTHERSQVTVHGGSTWDTHTLGRFDLADVGSKPRRVVHARLESLTAL